jgi:tetratricopeptide (TPR) repeat protein
MAQTNCCPNCGAERPANDTAGLCPLCWTIDALQIESPLPTDQLTLPGAGAAQHMARPDRTRNDPPDPGGVTCDYLADSDQTGTEDGASHGLPRGTVVRYFGDYEIQKELGRGGMGVVYEARRISLNRAVALKMIKAGQLADSDELRRFQNEAEAVALLDHPGIVPVYEIGEYEGQKYFSMKLVSGGSLVGLLSKYVDDPRAAARLTAQASEAVHHAHMRGILHRDLKPANILIDDTGQVHVTDFGLAKRVENDSEMTQSGAILGTPAYMSPEQASGRRGAVTTASDVYGLGAVLYALLTGQPPFVGDSVVETLEAVRKEPPAPPSKINRRVPRDLETICLKCLEKEPRRRYASAAALAEELKSWLDSRPISARRVNSLERVWLWYKRRPAIAAMAAAVLLALFVGAITSTALGLRAERNFRNEQAALHDANQRYELAMEAIATFHTGVSEEALLTRPELKDLRNRLLLAASEYYGRLGVLLERRSDLASRRALLDANYRVAGLTGSIGSNQDALAMHQRVLKDREALALAHGSDARARVDVARSLLAVGHLLETIGKTDEALRAYERARAVAAELSVDAATAQPARVALASADYKVGWLLNRIGKPDESLAALTRARDLQAALVLADPNNRDLESQHAEILSKMSELFEATGKPANALGAHEESRTIRQKLADANPSIDAFQNALAASDEREGSLLKRAGKRPEATKAYEAARAIRQKLADANPAVSPFQDALALNHDEIGNLLLEAGKTTEAMRAFEASLAIYQKLADANPAVTRFQNKIALAHDDIGMLRMRTGKPIEALKSYERSLAIYRRLADANPTVTDFQVYLALCQTRIGIHFASVAQPVEAVSAFRSALAILKRVANASPSVTQFQNYLAVCYNNIAWQTEVLGKRSEALASFEAAREIFKRLADANPDVVEFQNYLALDHCNIGDVQAHTGRLAGALISFEASRAILQRLVDTNRAAIQFEMILAADHRFIGEIRSQTGMASRAMAPCETSRAILQKLVAIEPGNTEFQSELGKTHQLIGRLLTWARKPAEALAAYDRARQVFEKLIAVEPRVASHGAGLAKALTGAAEVLRLEHRLDEARALCVRAIAAWQKVIKAATEVAEYKSGPAEGELRLSQIEHSSGDVAAASAATSRAIEIYKPIPSGDLTNDTFEACCHASISALAGLPGSAISPAQGEVEAKRAITILSAITARGLRHVDWWMSETALDPLRNRPDWKLLMMDLAMPEDPFAL